MLVERVTGPTRINLFTLQPNTSRVSSMSSTCCDLRRISLWTYL